MNFVTFQSVPYIAHVDGGVLCDDVRNFLQQINQIKSEGGTVTNFKKPAFERLTKYGVLSICLNKSMDPASLTLSGKWFHKLGSQTTKEQCVCVCVWVHAGARERACV